MITERSSLHRWTSNKEPHDRNTLWKLPQKKKLKVSAWDFNFYHSVLYGLGYWNLTWHWSEEENLCFGSWQWSLSRNADRIWKNTVHCRRRRISTTTGPSFVIILCCRLSISSLAPYRYSIHIKSIKYIIQSCTLTSELFLRRLPLLPSTTTAWCGDPDVMQFPVPCSLSH